ncbi:MAG: 3-hydroxyacyl-CoA dehydrogenase family protein, partial [Candidatus Sericytochromatia bacterium]
DVDLVIEAVVEDIAVKKQIFATLDKVCPAQTLIASNTSSLSITDMASATQRSDKVLGLHFFNPAFLMKLVEVVKGLETSQETVDKAYAFAEKLGKTPVLSKDTPGFIVNLLLIPYLLDAARVYENGLASATDIDNAMKLGAGYPMGPLTLMDLVGIDVCVKVGDILFDAYHEPKYNVPPLLRRMVMAGHFGRKSGKGFYSY